MSFCACAPANRPQVTVTSEDRQRPQAQALVSTSCSLNFKLRPTDPNQYLIKYFSVYLHILPSDVGGRVAPTLYIFRCSALCLLEPTLPPLLGRFHPSFCTLSQALVHSSPTKENLHTLTCPSLSHTVIRLCLRPLCCSLLPCNGISHR